MLAHESDNTRGKGVSSMLEKQCYLKKDTGKDAPLVTTTMITMNKN